MAEEEEDQDPFAREYNPAESLPVLDPKLVDAPVFKLPAPKELKATTPKPVPVPPGPGGVGSLLKRQPRARAVECKTCLTARVAALLPVAVCLICFLIVAFLTILKVCPRKKHKQVSSLYSY